MSASPVAHTRIVGLDIIRISLMLLIYLFHSHMHYHSEYGILNSFISMGAIAMTAFFMLSGYSLHIADGQKNLTDKTSLRQFYAKRFWGIMPLYYFCGSIYVIKILKLLRNKCLALFVVVLLISAVTVALHLGIPGDYMLYNWIALPCFIVLFISGGCIPDVNQRLWLILAKYPMHSFLCNYIYGRLPVRSL